MKVYRFLVLCFILLVLLISWRVSDAEAQPSLRGEMCWEFTDEEGLKGIVELGVLRIGGKHVLLSGKATSYDNGEPMILHGNLEIVGNNVLMTLCGSSRNEVMETNIVHVVLDRSTLDGTYEWIGHSRYSDGSIVARYGTGSLTSIPCPR